MGYIDRLPVSEPLRSSLRSLGADTPEALFSMIQAAPEQFVRFVGSEAAERIRSALREMVPEQLRHLLESPVPEYSLGAELQASPPLPDPGYSVEKRDRLFAELERLRSDPSQRRSPRIAQLEKELNEMLENRLK